MREGGWMERPDGGRRGEEARGWMLLWCVFQKGGVRAPHPSVLLVRPFRPSAIASILVSSRGFFSN